MIGLALLAAAGLGWWAWTTRDARALRWGDVAAVVAALIALHVLARGEGVTGLAILGGAGGWLWLRRGRDAAAGMSPAEARRLLGLSDAADGQAVRAAHRRLVARVHPDAGGSATLAAQVNAARDVLLARAGTKP